MIIDIIVYLFFATLGFAIGVAIGWEIARKQFEQILNSEDAEVARMMAGIE